MPKRSLILPNVSATLSLGRALGNLIAPSDIILLEGELGAGKTTLTQGIARGLGIDDDVLSPTFALMSEHRGGRVPLLHVDAYRLDGLADAEQLGVYEYLDNGWALAVEWAGNVTGEFPKDALTVYLEYEDDARRVTLTPGGIRSTALLESLNAAITGN